MKNIIFIVSAFLLYSCDNIDGSGHIQREKRNINHFDGVQASGSMDIEITEGDKFSVEIEADDNVLRYIIAEVDDGLLDVHFKDNTSFNSVHARVYVTAPALRKLYVKGSGNILSNNTIKSQSVDTKISGSGNINANIDAPDVKAEISGSGNLELQGRCKNFDASISGSGDLKCKNLLSENTNVSIYGSGTAHIFSSVKLKATTAGSGNIYYGGNPPSPDVTKAGSGTVEREN